MLRGRRNPTKRSRGLVVQELVSLLPLVAIALLFWLLIIRPASRRQKDQARMQSSLNEGDQVMLTSGIFGTLTQETDDGLMVEIAPGVTIRVARGAIGSVVPTGEPEVDETPDTEWDTDTDTDEGTEQR
jgi:preprotein translocase subunit YajC